MKRFVKQPLIVLAAGVLVLAGTSVGATRAAIESATQATVEFDTSTLQVDILENGETLTSSSTKSAELTFPSIQEDDSFEIGKKYSEVVSVKNTASYSEYVRVMVRKSWETEVSKDEFTKDTDLDPDLIELLGIDEGAWLKDEANSTTEGTVYYYKNKLAAGAEATLFTDIKINDDVNSIVSRTIESEDEKGKTIKHEYLYDGKYFYVELRVDAVQTNNGADAIYGAWGVNASLDSNGSITDIKAATF